MNRPNNLDAIQPRADVLKGYSLEITAKDIGQVTAAAARIPPRTRIAVAFLPSEAFAARISAAKLINELGFEAIPHFSARRLESIAEFEDYLAAVTSEAHVKRCVVIAGDTAEPEGPFSDSGALISSGAFERFGIEAIGIGGHPDGHPHMSDERCWQVLIEKCEEIERRRMAPFIVTQFAFDAERALAWLEALRLRRISAPVRIGIPGPAGIKTLVRFAARCGVGASAPVLAKYGISLGKLLGTAGPDRLVDEIRQHTGPEHGSTRLHFYPFGGMGKTVAWINEYDRAL